MEKNKHLGVILGGFDSLLALLLMCGWIISAAEVGNWFIVINRPVAKIVYVVLTGTCVFFCNALNCHFGVFFVVQTVSTLK